MSIPGPSNRPDHPDFWHLSELLLRHDAESTEAGESAVKKFTDEIGIDLDVVTYVSIQRAMIGLRRNHMHVDVPFIASQWFDGFVLGAAYAAKYGKVEEAEPEEIAPKKVVKKEFHDLSEGTVFALRLSLVTGNSADEDKPGPFVNVKTGPNRYRTTGPGSGDVTVGSPRIAVFVEEEAE